MRRMIRRAGAAGIQLTARESGTVRVEVWGHAALVRPPAIVLGSGPGQEWNWRDSEDGKGWEIEVHPNMLALTIASANAAVDSAIRLEAEAVGAVEQYPEV